MQCVYLKPKADLLYVGKYLISHEFELISGIRFIKQWPNLGLRCGNVAGVTGLSILFGIGSAHPGFVSSGSQWIKRVE
jgi:hypothetical protein